MENTFKYNSYDEDLVLINKTLYPEVEHDNNTHLGNNGNKHTEISTPHVNMNRVVPCNLHDDNIQSYEQYVDISLPYESVSYNDKNITNVAIGDNIPIPSTLPSTVTQPKKQLDVDEEEDEVYDSLLPESFMEVLTNDSIGSFYLGSISVIGLYLVFRMLRK